MNVNSKQERRKRIADFREDAIRIAQKNLFGPITNLAEDAAQASILKAIEKEHLYIGSMDRFKYWLHKIVINTCRDMGRKKREELSSDGDLSQLLWPTIEGSSNIYNIRESRKNIRAAINSLSDRDRKLIVLRYFFNLSGKEVAVFLNIPVKNVSVYCHRAKKSLIARHIL